MEGKKQGRFWIFGLAIGYIVLVAIWAFVISDWQHGRGFTLYDMLNVIAFVIIAFVLVYAGIKLNKAIEIGNELLDAKRNIELFKANNSSGIPDLTAFFKTAELREIYSKYNNEYQRIINTYKGTKLCGVDDFFSASSINDAFNRDILDQIPGALTGLGMLGTFVGLAAGISGVDLVTDEVMANIQPLLSSIQVAFYTSITGLALSILFNFALRQISGKTEEELQEFVIEYTKIVGSESRDGANLLVSSLNTFSVEIAKSIKEAVQAELKYMSDTYLLGVEQLEKATNASIDHVFEVFSENYMGDLNTCVNNLCQSVKDTTAYQEEATNELRKNVEAISKLSGFTTTISAITDKLNSFIGTIEESTGKLTEQVRLNNIAVQQAADNAHELKGGTEELSKQLGQMLKISDNLDDTVNFFTEGNKVVAEKLTDMVKRFETDYADIVKKTYENANNQLNASVKFMADQTDKLNESYKQVVESVNSVNKKLGDMVSEEKKERQITQDRFIKTLNEQSQRIEGNSQDFYKRADNIERSMENSAQDFYRHAQEFEKTMETSSRSLNKYAEDVSRVVESGTQRMSQSAAELEKSVSELKKMEKEFR